ncbi:MULTISPECIES: alkylmercury lyase family protein [unclassified Nocardioides]|uniref:alkylmercury lyase family protein n=1 Tax=unclassified Nocardioides TaxID=2615069 RepID=UPI0000571262|nr:MULTISPECIES: alkylmercury lyase family protein [unclassified Nocardioides]ABL81704.1 alkylmercury lyase [Nocardioides sp. JS614]
MKLEVLHVTDCPNVRPMLDRLAEATDLPVATREVTTDTEAATLGMNGSPTLLIDGTDPFAWADQCDCGVSCRLYRDQEGRIVPAPSVDQLREAIAEAKRTALARSAVVPGEVLSAWRSRAVPLDPVEKAVHQEILRAFAARGRPPAPSEFDAVTAAAGRPTSEVLSALHEADAIRLDPDGGIAVAYPFSSSPTRHRVRIADRVEVHAMCAIDALGISAMLGQNTRIDSFDVTSGEPITVTMTTGDATWEPNQVVVFVGATAGGGPSSDCCCDYLNFFTDRTAAQAWTSANPHIPGQILDRTEALDLAVRLFQPLLGR